MRRPGGRCLAIALAVPALCQGADSAVLERYARQHGWEAYAVAKVAGPDLPDVVPVMYSEDHGVFVVMCDGLASGACVRVTPAIFTSEAQVDRLVAALQG